MPNRFKSSGNLPWTCDVCDREMHENSMSAHLAGKDHARKTLTKSTIEPVKPSIGTGASLSSESASPIDQKARLCCSKSNSINSIEDGPLDYFFHSYPSFRYDHRLSPAISFKLLRAHLQKRRGWKFKGSKDRQLWCRYQDSLKQEFEVWFGDDDEMEAWHRLCRAIRISPLPATIALCRKAVHSRHVNIIDLIEWGRTRHKHLQIFPTVQALSRYSYQHNKIVQKEKLKSSRAVLRHLLRVLT